MRRAVLIVAAWIFAASGLAACRARGTLEPMDSGGAGGPTSIGPGGANGSGGSPPAGSAGAGGTVTSGQGGAAGAITGGAGTGALGGAGGAPATACSGGAVFAFLVRSLTTFAPGDGGLSFHGFDLDGRASDGSAPEDCGVSDETSPDGRTGIDNAIGGLWGEDFSSLFNQSYARGISPIVIRLSGVDDFDSDDCVDVEWSGGQWVGAAVDPASPQAAGQLLRQDRPTSRLLGARIENGRLLADGDGTIALRAEHEGVEGVHRLDLPLALSRISFAASAEQLTQGELGGRLDPQDVYRAYQSVFGSLVTRDQVASILRPDLPSGQSRCALLSAGYGFEAVGVTIVP